MTIANKLRGALICSALVTLGAADTAAARTYTISGDFGRSVFAYGRGDGGSTFVPYTTHSACLPQLICYPVRDSTALAGSIVKNIGSTALVIGGLSIAPSTVQFHPYDGSSNSDAIIRFTAPATASWQVSGSLWRNDTLGYGDGATLSIFTTVGNVTNWRRSASLTPILGTQHYAFSPFSEALHAGDTIDFAISSTSGNNDSDATGIEAIFHADDSASGYDPTSGHGLHPGAVPEPSSWAMLMGGFGLVGAMARRQHRRQAVPA